MENQKLVGSYVRLEPLELFHLDGLTKAAAGNEQLYKWTVVPQGKDAMTAYIKTAHEQRDGGTAVPFAIIGNEDGIVKGSTRFWNIAYWPWPEHTYGYGRIGPDVCEIGHTWLTRSATKTGINTEAKFLMLKYAFEYWKVWRVNFTTDVRNERSRAAIERLGARFEGIIRAERMGADFTVRDSARFSIILNEWEEIKEHLIILLKQY
nr:GNAT family protein [uncultured Pedobacter sp.]